MLLYSCVCKLVVKKKKHTHTHTLRSGIGDSSGEYAFITHQTHTVSGTYANNKELHRHWVTLGALINRHICAHVDRFV